MTLSRALEYFLIVFLLAAAVTAAVFAVSSRKDNDNTSTVITTKSQPAKKQQTACTIFTLADAKQLLGDSAKGGINPIYDTPQGDIDVSSCNYVQDSGSNTPVASKDSATLLVRAPKTSEGITSNQNQFNRLRPASVEDVPGYGDAAYWDSEHGQLNILKSNNWYILSYGPITPSERSLEQTKQMADLLINKL